MKYTALVATALFITACSSQARDVAPVATRAVTPTVPIALLINAQSTASAQSTAAAATASALQLREIASVADATHQAAMQAAQLQAASVNATAISAVATAQFTIANATASAIPTVARATAESMAATQAAIYNGMELDAQRHRQQLEDEAFYGGLQQVVAAGTFALVGLAVLVGIGWGAVRTVGAWHKLQAEAQAALLVADAQARLADSQSQYMQDVRTRRALHGQVSTPATPVAAGDEVVTFVKAAIAADTALKGTGTRIPPAHKMGNHWAGGNWQRAVDALAERGLITKTGDAPNAGWQVVGGNLHQLLIDVGG